VLRDFHENTFFSRKESEESQFHLRFGNTSGAGKPEIQLATLWSRNSIHKSLNLYTQVKENKIDCQGSTFVFWILSEINGNQKIDFQLLFFDFFGNRVAV